MKWTLLTLLVVNLLFGVYQYWESRQPISANDVNTVAKFNNLNPSPRQLQRITLVNSKTPVIREAENQCIKIKGLSVGDGLEVVESRLKALEVKLGRVEETVVLRQDFQVIVGPYASSDLARNELQILANNGIESYVINSGDNKNALSLGVFSSNANAERKRNEVLQLGFGASIAIKDHKGSATSLIVGPESSALVNDATLESVLSPFKKATFSRYQCN